MNQLVDTVDVCPPNNTILNAYDMPPRDTSGHDLGSSQNVPGPHPRHCVNTLSGNLPELSVSDIETQLGPSTGFELSEPNLADDSPKSIIPNAVFSNELSTTPPPSEISIQRMAQQRPNLVHPNPDSVRQSYSQRPVDQCREYQPSNQSINVQQHQIPRSSLVTVPVPQSQVRPMQQQHIDPQSESSVLLSSYPLCIVVVDLGVYI